MTSLTPIANSQSIIVDAVEMAGGQRALARKIGLSQSDISQALSGSPADIPDRVFNALGYFVRTEKYLVPMKGQNR